LLVLVLVLVLVVLLLLFIMLLLRPLRKVEVGNECRRSVAYGRVGAAAPAAPLAE